MKANYYSVVPGGQNPESIADMSSMTLQICLVGTDGVVLASDRLLQQYEQGGRSATLISKVLQAQDVVCCYSGDILAERAANRIRAFDWATQSRAKEDLRSVLINFGSQVYQDAEAESHTVLNYVRKVIVILYSSQVWLLEVGKQSVANQVIDRVVAGDAANTCRYFVNKYASDCYRSMNVEQLLGIASYAVLAAGDENPHGVGGLEVVVIYKNSEPRTYSPEIETALRRRYKETDALIRDALTKPAITLEPER